MWCVCFVVGFVLFFFFQRSGFLFISRRVMLSRVFKYYLVCFSFLQQGGRCGMVCHRLDWSLLDQFEPVSAFATLRLALKWNKNRTQRCYLYVRWVALKRWFDVEFDSPTHLVQPHPLDIGLVFLAWRRQRKKERSGEINRSCTIRHKGGALVNTYKHSRLDEHRMPMESGSGYPWCPVRA